MKDPCSIFWFRRDLRLDDNHGLSLALKSGFPVRALFIFDENILSELDLADSRVTFIHSQLVQIQQKLEVVGSGLEIRLGDPIEVWKTLIEEYEIKQVFTNKDYEPYAIKRDKEIKSYLEGLGKSFISVKDQVIFEENEITKPDGLPYTVFTPFKNKWLSSFRKEQLQSHSTDFSSFAKIKTQPLSLEEIGFSRSPIKVMNFDLDILDNYATNREYPAVSGTSRLGPHLRFGTISIRKIIQQVLEGSTTFLAELIWREFFSQIMWHFPNVVQHNFRRKYDQISWRKNEEELNAWKEGKTGYPLVDAGMRELTATGYMHNRVRMITAGFLCKHLLQDWRLGEAFFAEHLLDYDLASNNGNWQWAAGTGCDAAPYFRVFNPITQQNKFDKNQEYIKKWIPELENGSYLDPIVQHQFARVRALKTYKDALT